METEWKLYKYYAVSKYVLIHKPCKRSNNEYKDGQLRATNTCNKCYKRAPEHLLIQLKLLSNDY